MKPKPKKKPATKLGYVMPRDLFRSMVKELTDLTAAVFDQACKFELNASGVKRDLEAVRSTYLTVEGLRDELRSAVARKPNLVLQDLAYQLKATRQELAMVQEEMARNNGQINKLIGCVDSMCKLLEPVPTAKAANSRLGWVGS